MGGQQIQSFLIQAVRTIRLELHQRYKALRRNTVKYFMRFHIELLQLGYRQVNASAQSIFAHITDDVRQLKRLAQRMRVGGGCWVCLPKNLG